MTKPKVRHVKFTEEEMAYDIPDKVDFSKHAPVIGCGIYAAEMRGEPPLKIAYVVVDDSAVTFSLADGRRVSAPLGWYPRLQHATPGERNNWRPIMGARAVIWRDLGIAVSAKALLEGTKASESPASLRKWLTERNKGQQRKAVA